MAKVVLGLFVLNLDPMPKATVWKCFVFRVSAPDQFFANVFRSA
ncbi:hypothetical protein SAMN06296036_10736 [Pseudobacteriovorax antillogorgiicola]|uniref:Uncharacterized protein n=1 Tax=Pseudobacteriovorax antillogorgiicola TaxID=1513793 RepID=A0A1Y6BVB3_9BACT|nr:hypothetical protein EDD56_107236 [Pseudobacteriovorax antillogorgiicola]SMF20539.1 hypothetical protein SAMN06296036_10736 [Pseudobacteriovorax antillogorgiicola]